MKKKHNQDQKRARKVGQLATLLRQYARKAQRGIEPNDRRYDRAIESAVKRMPADELDRLLRQNEESAGCERIDRTVAAVALKCTLPQRLLEKTAPAASQT